MLQAHCNLKISVSCAVEDETSGSAQSERGLFPQRKGISTGPGY